MKKKFSEINNNIGVDEFPFGIEIASFDCWHLFRREILLAKWYSILVAFSSQQTRYLKLEFTLNSLQRDNMKKTKNKKTFRFGTQNEFGIINDFSQRKLSFEMKLFPM